MAWNDPPSFNYQQISGSGRKFKHRYVLSETNSRYCQSSPQFQQSAPASANHNQFQQHQQSVALMNQSHPQQAFNVDNSQSFGLQPNYNTTDNGTIINPPTLSSSGANGASHGFNNDQSGVKNHTSNNTSHNNFDNYQAMMYQNQPQQFQPEPPPQPPQQMISHQQSHSFQPL